MPSLSTQGARSAFRRFRSPAALAATSACAALLIAAGAAAGEPSSSHVAAAKGGAITFLSSSDVDSLDPGRTCDEFPYSVDAAVNRTLYYYKPGSLTPTPDLASGPPRISNGGKTVTVHLRAGVMFGPPVNRAVTSADVKYAFERMFTKQVGTCYAAPYYGDLVGAPAGGGNYRPISGITTPNKLTIVFRLKHTTAGGFVPALAMPGAGAVPKEYALKYDRANPSTYGLHVVATGPYMVQSYRPGVTIVLTRNPNWKRATDFRPAALDKITIDEGNSDLAIASQRALTGSSTICCNANPPGPELKTASQMPAQLISSPAGTTDFLKLNYKLKPFNNINIRKAVAAVINRESLLLSLGGAYAASPGTGFLPPGVQGYTPNEGSQFDYMRSATGDPAVAKKYMLLARKQGLPVSADGKYTGPQNLVIMGVNTDPASKAPLIIQSELQQLGFKTTVRLVSYEAYNSKFCGFTQLVPAVCANEAITKDFPDGITIDSVFSTDTGLLGVAIPGNAMVNAVTAAERTPAGAARARSWQKVNNLALSQAMYLPYAYPKNVVLVSKNVATRTNPLYSGHGVDFSFTSLK